MPTASPLKGMVIDARDGWTLDTEALLPGGFVAVVVSSNVIGHAQAGRAVDLELRDTLVVVEPGPKHSFVLLFRKPLTEKNVVDQILAAGTGALNIKVCRIAPRSTAAVSKDGRWPGNFVLIHGACEGGVCEPYCPVAAVGEQSGFSESSNDPNRFQGTTKFKNGAYVKEGDVAAATIKNGSATAYGDSGGADRYFPVFDGHADMRTWLARLVGIFECSDVA